MMLEFADVTCPHCGEPLQLAIDPSGGAQRYIEDCQVCCRPMVVSVEVDDDGGLGVDVVAEGA